jgi:hypothetical protein
MKNNSLWLALALASVVGFTTTQVQARGGGGRREAPRAAGGGERFESNTRVGGEGQRGEVKNNFKGPNRTQGNEVNRASTAQNRVSQIQAHYSPQNKPFSPAWYADHPQAWRATHSFAGNWAAASLGAATAWMGMSAAAGESPVYADGTVLTGDDDSDDDNNQPAQTDQPQPPQTYQAQPAQASQLAQTGSDLANDADWLPLGVYALKGKNQSEATAMLQLSVNKDGVLRGSYYDVVSDQSQAIQGAVDKTTQRVAWKVGSKGPVVFETTLANLTQTSGSVSLHFANGESRQWNLARLPNPAPTE